MYENDIINFIFLQTLNSDIKTLFHCLFVFATLYLVKKNIYNIRNERDDRGMRQLYFGTGESFLFKLTPGHDGEGEMVR